MTSNANQTRYQAIRNVTILGLVANILLAISKILFGFIGQSQALIADGLHSLSDLVSDAVVLVAARYAVADADDAHPYGHKRFETVATVAVGSLLLFVAVGVFSDAVYRLLQPNALLMPAAISLVAALASIAVKEGLYQYTFHVAKQVHSPMLRANAWHHRSDALSSILVFIGVTGTLFGFAWLDAVAALLVSMMIFHIGWTLSAEGLQQLVDTGVSPALAEKIARLIVATEGVRTIHKLRTRYMGDSILVDVHIIVDAHISVSEGHYIGDRVTIALRNAMPDIADMTVHIDPEDDAQGSRTPHLPPRSTLLEQLRQAWQPLLHAHQVHLDDSNVTLHYLHGKISVEVHLPLHMCDTFNAEAALQALGKRLTNVADVKVYYRAT